MTFELGGAGTYVGRGRDPHVEGVELSPPSEAARGDAALVDELLDGQRVLEARGPVDAPVDRVGAGEAANELLLAERR